MGNEWGNRSTKPPKPIGSCQALFIHSPIESSATLEIIISTWLYKWGHMASGSLRAKPEVTQLGSNGPAFWGEKNHHYAHQGWNGLPHSLLSQVCFCGCGRLPVLSCSWEPAAWPRTRPPLGTLTALWQMLANYRQSVVERGAPVRGLEKAVHIIYSIIHLLIHSFILQAEIVHLLCTG